MILLIHAVRGIELFEIYEKFGGSRGSSAPPALPGSAPMYSVLQNISSSALIILRCLGTVTQSPSAACIGDSITVSCVLNPSPGDEFISLVTSFIIGNSSNPIIESTVNTYGYINGIDLSRFTAGAPIGDITRVTGSITLLSYQTYDEGLLMGCRNDVTESEGIRITPFFETLNLNQASELHEYCKYYRQVYKLVS